MAELLRALVECNQLTGAELAARIGASEPEAAGILSGAAGITPAQAAAIEEAFGLQPGAFGYQP